MPINFSEHAKFQIRKRRISGKKILETIRNPQEIKQSYKNRRMKIHYDPKVDAAYIELAKGKYEVSREISQSVVVDEDKNGKILGVEVLDVSRVFDPKFRANMKNASYPTMVAHRISK